MVLLLLNRPLKTAFSVLAICLICFGNFTKPKTLEIKQCDLSFFKSLNKFCFRAKSDF